jgi:RNase P subunit RPR2
MTHTLESTGHAALYRMYPKQNVTAEYSTLLEEYFENKEKIGFKNVTSLDATWRRRDNEFMKACRLPLEQLKEIVRVQRIAINALESLR